MLVYREYILEKISIDAAGAARIYFMPFDTHGVDGTLTMWQLSFPVEVQKDRCLCIIDIDVRT